MIRLTPFPVEDLIAALWAPADSPLIVEVHMALLRLVLANREAEEQSQQEKTQQTLDREVLSAPSAALAPAAGAGGGEEAVAPGAAVAVDEAGEGWEALLGPGGLVQSAAIDESSWIEALCGLTALSAASAADAGLRPSTLDALREGGYAVLSVKQRVVLLEWLCNYAASTALVHDCLDQVRPTPPLHHHHSAILLRPFLPAARLLLVLPFFSLFLPFFTPLPLPPPSPCCAPSCSGLAWCSVSVFGPRSLALVSPFFSRN